MAKIAVGVGQRIDTLMKATVSRIDILQECYFTSPAFNLARGTPDVIKAYYEHISPRFHLQLDQISVVSSNILSELAVKIGLFQDAANLEIKIDKMVFLATKVQSDKGLTIIKDVLRLAYDARESAFPEIGTGSARFLVHSWLALDGGEKAAAEVIGKAAKPKKDIRLLDEGETTKISYNLRIQLNNESEGWGVTVTQEPSALPLSHLFVAMDFVFGIKTKYKTLGQQFEFVEEKYANVLSSMGIDDALLRS